MSDPIKSSARAPEPEPAVPDAPPKPDVPASLTDARLGPAGDPAEGKRE